MWIILKNWLAGNALRLAGWAAIALSVSAVLFGIRQSGRNAERALNLKKSLEIKDAQLRATLDAPRNRGELADRLRDGKF
jgi:hypothetical protein